MSAKKWKICEVCGKSLSNYTSLWRHKKRYHTGSNGSLYRGDSNRLNIRPFHQIQTVTSDIEQTIPTWHQRMPAAAAAASVDQYSDDDNSANDETEIATYAWRDRQPSDAVKSTDNHAIATYAWRDDGSIEKNHSFLLPRDVRAIIIGKSGSGKTTLLTSLLLEPDMMDYEKLMVCGKSLHQPEYRAMQLGFNKGLSKNQIRKIFKRQDDVMQDGGPEKVISDVKICKGGVDASFFDDVTMIPDPSEEDRLQRNLLVLDDVMLGPQNKVEAYFTRGRHNNIDVIYIAQSYFRLPRQTIRENANLFMFFLQDRKNLVHIFNDHCAGDGIPFDIFCKFCNDVWRDDKHNFITIDLSRSVNNGKYRRNLTDFWIV